VVGDAAARAGVRDDDAAAYEAPQLIVLGTLAELTLGGSSGPDDFYGGAGDSGSL
jgi:hypothetical protein